MTRINKNKRDLPFKTRTAKVSSPWCETVKTVSPLKAS